MHNSIDIKPFSDKMVLTHSTKKGIDIHFCICKSFFEREALGFYSFAADEKEQHYRLITQLSADIVH